MLKGFEKKVSNYFAGILVLLAISVAGINNSYAHSKGDEGSGYVSDGIWHLSAYVLCENGRASGEVWLRNYKYKTAKKLRVYFKLVGIKSDGSEVIVQNTIKPGYGVYTMAERGSDTNVDAYDYYKVQYRAYNYDLGRWVTNSSSWRSTTTCSTDPDEWDWVYDDY